MKTNLELYWGVMDGNRWLQETPRRERSFFVTNRQTLYHNIYIIVTIIASLCSIMSSKKLQSHKFLRRVLPLSLRLYFCKQCPLLCVSVALCSNVLLHWLGLFKFALFFNETCTACHAVMWVSLDSWRVRRFSQQQISLFCSFRFINYVCP